MSFVETWAVRVRRSRVVAAVIRRCWRRRSISPRFCAVFVAFFAGLAVSVAAFLVCALPSYNHLASPPRESA